MAIQVGRAILPFTVNGFVGLLQDSGPSSLRFLKMSIDIIHKYGQTLRSVSKLFWARATWPGSFEHYVGIPKVHLRTTDRTRRVTMVIMLGKPENSG